MLNAEEMRRLLADILSAHCNVSAEGTLVTTSRYAQPTPELKRRVAAAHTELRRWMQGLCWKCAAPLLLCDSEDDQQQWCSNEQAHFFFRQIVVECLPDGDKVLTYELNCREVESVDEWLDHL
jgi:hypothetical protein